MSAAEPLPPSDVASVSSEVADDQVAMAESFVAVTATFSPLPSPLPSSLTTSSMSIIPPVAPMFDLLGDEDDLPVASFQGQAAGPKLTHDESVSGWQTLADYMPSPSPSPSPSLSPSLSDIERPSSSPVSMPTSFLEVVYSPLIMPQRPVSEPGTARSRTSSPIPEAGVKQDDKVDGELAALLSTIIFDTPNNEPVPVSVPTSVPDAAAPPAPPNLMDAAPSPVDAPVLVGQSSVPDVAVDVAVAMDPMPDHSDMDVAPTAFLEPHDSDDDRGTRSSAPSPSPSPPPSPPPGDSCGVSSTDVEPAHTTQADMSVDSEHDHTASSETGHEGVHNVAGQQGERSGTDGVQNNEEVHGVSLYHSSEDDDGEVQYADCGEHHERLDGCVENRVVVYHPSLEQEQGAEGGEGAEGLQHVQHDTADDTATSKDVIENADEQLHEDDVSSNPASTAHEFTPPLTPPRSPVTPPRTPPPAVANKEDDGEKPKPDHSLQNSLDEVNELEGAWMDFRESMAVFGGCMEEVLVRVSHELKSHSCAASGVPALVAAPAPTPAPAPSPPTVDPEMQQQVIRLIRENQLFGTRVLKAETEVREANTQRQRMEQELARVVRTLEEEREKSGQAVDMLERSEAHRKTYKKGYKSLSSRFVALEEDYAQLTKDSGALKQEVKDPSGFAIVLMEGEARMFDPKQVGRGYEGGAATAALIRSEAERLVKLMALGTEVTAMIHLFLDLEKTINELLETGVIKSVRDFDDFLEGFSSADDQIVISDTTGLFGASIKIRAKMNMLGSLRPCKLVLLVAGQDRQYLDTIGRLGDEVKSKVFVARSTGVADVDSDPFQALGNGRLFYIPFLFPTTPLEWSQLRSSKGRTVNNINGNNGPVNRAPNNATPRPTNNKTHDERPKQAYPQVPQVPMGSPIPFTPMPTGSTNRSGSVVNGYQASDVSGTGYQSTVNTETAPYGRLQSEASWASSKKYPESSVVSHMEASAETYFQDRERVSRQRPPPPKPASRQPAAPPWQEIRASQGPTGGGGGYSTSRAADIPLRRPVGIRLAHDQMSVGGSPPSSDDDELLLSHVPAASRTHVIRPPQFYDAIERPPSTGSLISTVTTGTVKGGGRGGGGPPAGFRLAPTYGNNSTSYGGGPHREVRHADLAGNRQISPEAKVKQWQTFK